MTVASQIPQGWRFAVADFFNSPESDGYVVLHRRDYHRAISAGVPFSVSGSGPTFEAALAKAIKEAEKARALP